MKIGFLLSLCGLLVAGCGSRSTSVTIGAAGPWTRAVGATTKQGIELAVSEVNAAGGIGGRPLQVVMQDDSGSGARAAAIAQKFVSADSIVGVIGDVNSGPTIAAAKVYDGHLPLIATAATSPQLTGISPWVFRVISSDSINGTDIARFAGRLGRKRAVVIYENDSYGRGLADAFRRSFSGSIVSMDPIEPDETNLEPYVAYYKRRAPDIVFGVGGGISGVALLREARRQHLTTDFVGGDGWTAIVNDTTASQGVYVSAPFTPQDPRPEVQHFVTAFRQKFGTMPDDKAALGYDAAQLLAQAIAKQGENRAAVRAYLASLTNATAYRGVTGIIQFRTDGDPEGKGFTMTHVKDGLLLLADRGAHP